MSREIPIGAAARASGVKVSTIRFYEQIGLMPPMPRSVGNRRLYSAGDVRLLTFIRHARELGFQVDAIRTLLALQDEPNQSCAVADEIARAHLVEVKQRIASLEALREELERMIRQCSHGRIADCRVIETLDDHGACGQAHAAPDTRLER